MKTTNATTTTLATLKAQAKAAGIKGYYRMSKAALVAALASYQATSPMAEMDRLAARQAAGETVQPQAPATAPVPREARTVNLPVEPANLAAPAVRTGDEPDGTTVTAERLAEIAAEHCLFTLAAGVAFAVQLRHVQPGQTVVYYVMERDGDARQVAVTLASETTTATEPKATVRAVPMAAAAQVTTEPTAEPTATPEALASEPAAERHFFAHYGSDVGPIHAPIVVLAGQTLADAVAADADRRGLARPDTFDAEPIDATEYHRLTGSAVRVPTTATVTLSDWQGHVKAVLADLMATAADLAERGACEAAGADEVTAAALLLEGAVAALTVPAATVATTPAEPVAEIATPASEPAEFVAMAAEVIAETPAPAPMAEPVQDAETVAPKGNGRRAKKAARKPASKGKGRRKASKGSEGPTTDQTPASEPQDAPPVAVEPEPGETAEPSEASVIAQHIAEFLEGPTGPAIWRELGRQVLAAEDDVKAFIAGLIEAGRRETVQQLADVALIASVFAAAEEPTEVQAPQGWDRVAA